jgi:hypothetical protein
MMIPSNRDDHPAHDHYAWGEILRNEVIPEGLRSGGIRLLDANEVSESPCLVASGAPRNPTGTHASIGYPGGREAWIRAFECWFKKMLFDSLVGTLRRPYQHAARLGIELPAYEDLPARGVKADEVRIYSWPEHYHLTVWRRPAAGLSEEDWEDIARLLAAEIKYRKTKGSRNPYEDACVPDPVGRVRDWEAVLDLSREAVLRSPTPWDRRTWIKCTSKAIWRVNRLSEPKARIAAGAGRWEPLPDIVVPSPSLFNGQSAIHLEIEEAFLGSVRDYEENDGERLNRVIRKGEGIVPWWESLCWISQSKLREQSEKTGELWKEAENSVRERHGLPRIGEGWVSEVALLNLVQDAFPCEPVIHHARPKWLGRQHLDIFLPDRSVAVEYQGEQHFVPVDFFGGWEALDETQKRDQRKSRLCAQNGVRLIYFRSDDPITRETVQKRIEKASREMG